MLQKKYQTQQTAIASYDYTDIASGTGYSIFYGGNLSDGTSASGSYVLSNNVFYSENLTTEAVKDTTVWFHLFDIDFDSSPFNLPRVVQGKALLNVTLGHSVTGGPLAYMRLSGSRIIKYDGTNETVLATFDSDVYGLGADAGSHVFAVDADIAQTTFKEGDILRLNVNASVYMDGAGGETWGIAHDPAERAGSVSYYTATDTTALKLHVPFKIDL